MSDTTLISRKEPLADGVCVVVSGDIDLSRSPELRVTLLEMAKNKPKRLVVDLSAVPYMDSSGVATLVEALQVQRRHQGKLVLCGLQPKVQSIFEIARLTMVFTIVTDMEAAKTR
jgi:anti-sigma B factor antagonist